MARTREIQPEAGVRCWSYGSGNYPLSDDMPDRAEGVIISRNGQDVVVEIQGRRWQVRWWQLDCGMEYETRSGEWIREPDPRVRRFVEHQLRDYQLQVANRGKNGEDMFAPCYRVRKCRWILRRNGWSDSSAGD